jgi:hypothetical protein
MTTISRNTVVRTEMLHACIEKQQLLIDDFKVRIETLLQTEGLGNEEEYDNSEQANTSQRMDEVNSLTKALDFANREMDILNYLEFNVADKHEQPELGAVVITNLNTFFISVSTEQFELDGQTFIGLSVHSPLFQVMREKKKGDTFNYNKITYKIIDIF